ncbi:hypothetical protein [Aeromonas dhakensis]|uniref:hypothetical protein n=1 Tax=Aeromonas dhakensis TaxID=196024 RepID=UPI00191D3CD8|nr:hypothetical protein [Aeromonas dhakensis]MBL0634208.1 hypothetical protein [Aeromonas dhakensis]
MNGICEICGDITASQTAQEIGIGNEVTFTELTISRAGMARIRAKEGTVKEVKGDYLTIKQKWSRKTYLRHKTSVQKVVRPNPLTLALSNLCECNTTESQKEQQQ